MLFIENYPPQTGPSGGNHILSGPIIGGIRTLFFPVDV